ncbi:hypothetical protein F4X86_03590 [Candidatus Saccharibacteria bacterium]|nr:hypothetical protein [Candidatus Saccharibacteria bacterium]
MTKKSVRDLSLIGVLIAIATAMLFVATNSNASRRSDIGSKFVPTPGSLTDTHRVETGYPDGEAGEEVEDWSVELQGYTGRAYFLIHTPKSVRKEALDFTYDIESVYHAFVRNSNSCNLNHRGSLNDHIARNFDEINNFSGRVLDDENNTYRMATDYVSPRDRQQNYNNGSCVIVQARLRLTGFLDRTIYASYYIRYGYYR